MSYLKYLSGVLVLIAFLALLEGAMCLSGLGSVPLYLRDGDVGYRVRPSQAGEFLNSFTWAFNERSMGVARRYDPNDEGTLLLGDSIVMGNSWMNQPERLGPRIEQMTGCAVWPLSASSWAVTNELRMLLQKSSDLLASKTIIIVSNSEDLGPASVWKSEITHPQRNPSPLLWFLVQKAILKSDSEKILPSMKDTGLWRQLVLDFASTYKGRIIWILYPKRNELEHPSSRLADLGALVRSRATVLYAGDIPGWGRSDYNDEIHPNAKGYAKLSRQISNALGHCSNITRS